MNSSGRQLSTTSTNDVPTQPIQNETDQDQPKIPLPLPLPQPKRYATIVDLLRALTEPNISSGPGVCMVIESLMATFHVLTDTPHQYNNALAFSLHESSCDPTKPRRECTLDCLEMWFVYDAEQKHFSVRGTASLLLNLTAYLAHSESPVCSRTPYEIGIMAVSACEESWYCLPGRLVGTEPARIRSEPWATEINATLSPTWTDLQSGVMRDVSAFHVAYYCAAPYPTANAKTPQMASQVQLHHRDCSMLGQVARIKKVPDFEGRSYDRRKTFKHCALQCFTAKTVFDEAVEANMHLQMVTVTQMIDYLLRSDSPVAQAPPPLIGSVAFTSMRRPTLAFSEVLKRMADPRAKHGKDDDVTDDDDDEDEPQDRNKRSRTDQF